MALDSLLGDGYTHQVLEDYGHPNHVLLLVHGFSLGRENSHDCVRIDARRPSQQDAGTGYWEMLARVEKVGDAQRCEEEGSPRALSALGPNQRNFSVGDCCRVLFPIQRFVMYFEVPQRCTHACVWLVFFVLPRPRFFFLCSEQTMTSRNPCRTQRACTTHLPVRKPYLFLVGDKTTCPTRFEVYALCDADAARLSTPTPPPRILFQAFPLGRPMFCISLRRNGPYDFVSYARIMAGLPPTLPEHHQQQGDPASMSSGDHGDGADVAASSSIGSGASSPEHERHARSPSSDRDHPEFARSFSTCPTGAAAAPSSERDQYQCGRSTARTDSNGPGPIPSGGAPGVHRRWEALRGDPEGLRAVLDALVARLEGYGGGGRVTVYEGDASSGGGVDGFVGEEGQGDYYCADRWKNGNSNNNEDGADLWAISVEETTQVSKVLLASSTMILRSRSLAKLCRCGRTRCMYCMQQTSESA